MNARLFHSGLLIDVVPMGPEHLDFVVGAMCNIARPRGTPFDKWRTFYRDTALAACKASDVVVALSLDAAPDVYLGFASARQGVLEMVYVKLQFRGNGIGIELLKGLGLASPVTVMEPNAGFKKWADLHRVEWVKKEG